MRKGLLGGYVIDDAADAVDRDQLYEWLTTDSYWWTVGLARPVLEAALDHSICLSLLAPDGQFAGFARLVTDSATFAYLADVYVDEAHRGHGLGKQLTATAVAYPAVATCRRFMLATRDAHSLYAQQGFTPLSEPSIFMEIVRPHASA